MLDVLVFLVISFQPDTPPVEATRFGVTLETARANHKAAVRCRDYIRREFDGEIRERWDNRQIFAARAWDILADALDPNFPMQYRHFMMRWLRESIGMARFDAGEMPPPIPDAQDFAPIVKGK
jgi:hypothetical protein